MKPLYVFCDMCLFVKGMKEGACSVQSTVRGGCGVSVVKAGAAIQRAARTFYLWHTRQHTHARPARIGVTIIISLVIRQRVELQNKIYANNKN